MSKKNLPQWLCLVLFFICMLVPKIVSADTYKDITQEGINFLENPPAETTVYTAGDGTVTYEPAKNGESAVITLKDATINGRQTAYYQDRNQASAAILASGNVDMVLLGENNIKVTEISYGLFFFNGNVNIKGPGSLTIDVLVPLGGLSGIKILNGKDADEDMGDFTLIGGEITLRMQPEDVSYCLSARKNITIENGVLTIEGGDCSVLSICGDINVRDSVVTCKNFKDKGLVTHDGDIVVEGENTVLDISALEGEPRSIGMCAESETKVPYILIKDGIVDISAGQSGIYADAGGSITVAGGKISGKAENTDNINAVGLWATGEINITDGTVQATGIADMGIGIYSDKFISVSGGEVIAKGTVQAVSHVPDTSKYKRPAITAALDFEGNSKEKFSAEKLESYKYLHIASEIGLYEIQYEDGQALITAPQDSRVTVIFVAYDDLGRMTGLEVKEESLSEGENVITPEYFSPVEGKIKVMLWDNISTMIPLCSFETEQGRRF